MKNKFSINGSTVVVYVKRRNGDEFKILVDVDDLEIIKNFSWSVSYSESNNAYYAYSAGNRFAMHRMLTDAQKGFDVDHVNHNTLDNRRCNLRIATKSQNQQNRLGAPRNSSSGIRGVHWDKRDKRWVARIRINNKKKTIGRYKDMLEAQQAVIEARAKYMPFSQEARSGIFCFK